MSRIYLVTDKGNGRTVRYVRALSLNGAVRALAAELFDAKAASSDEVYQAMKSGAEVLDAVKAAEEVDDE
jgi:hypothetical protein